MNEMSLITADNAYYTCLGDYDPTKDDTVQENSNSNLEVSFWYKYYIEVFLNI